MKSAFTELPVPTSDGIFLARYSEVGLAELEFPGRSKPSAAGRRAVSGGQIPLVVLRWHRLTTRAVQAVLAGRSAGALPPLDWCGKTDFQKSVWRQILKISAGRTKSYRELAVALKNPLAARAVGGACGANPIPVLVPCHRVLAANQKIGGFSGGLAWKKLLLQREGVVPAGISEG